MADKRNRTPFYGAVPTSKLQADHVFMADGSTLQEHFPTKAEDVIYDNSNSKMADTDVQAAIDTLAIYSTDETVIGRWIDGRPLYRKCVLTDHQGNTAHSITNVDFFTNIQAVGRDGSNTYPLPYYLSGSNAGYVYAGPVNINIGVVGLGNQWFFVILDYVKTTDTGNRSLQNKINKELKKIQELYEAEENAEKAADKEGEE